MSNAGRPLKYNTSEDIQNDIDEYFDSCVPEYLKDDNGEYVVNKGSVVIASYNKPTITGLALHLGFESRQSMYDYEKRGEFSYTIKRARLKIENSYEQDIRNPDLTPTGAIFGLKNFGWSDKSEISNVHKTIDENGDEKGIDYSKISTEALKELVNASKG